MQGHRLERGTAPGRTVSFTIGKRRASAIDQRCIKWSMWLTKIDKLNFKLYTADACVQRRLVRAPAGPVPESNSLHSVYEYPSSHATWTTEPQFRQVRKSKLVLSDLRCVA